MSDIALDIQIDVGIQQKDIQIVTDRTVPNIEMNVEKGSGQYFPDYEGSYRVTSSLYDIQTLETRNKRMKENMQVRPIPIHTVVNPSGGYTITIGE